MVFYAKIASETNTFDLAEVLDTAYAINLLFRHPHIYGDTKVNTEEEVKQNWEKLKIKRRQ